MCISERSLNRRDIPSKEVVLATKNPIQDRSGVGEDAGGVDSASNGQFEIQISLSLLHLQLVQYPW